MSEFFKPGHFHCETVDQYNLGEERIKTDQTSIVGDWLDQEQ